MHAALERLYSERPGGDPLPRPGSLAAWIARGRELVAEVAAERELGAHPAERAMARRVERLLERFLAEEAERETGGFEPWLLEARFGERRGQPSGRRSSSAAGACTARSTGSTAAADGRAVVIDYKLSGAVTAAREVRGAGEAAAAALPARGRRALGRGRRSAASTTRCAGPRTRRPRGVVAEESAADLAGYDLYDGDVRRRARSWRSCWSDSRRRGGEIVARMRAGEIRRDPGPREGLRGHDVCPTFCAFAPICRRDRAPVSTRRTRKWRSGERARRRPPSRRRRSRRRPRRPARGRRRHRQDRGDGRPLLPPGLRRGRLPRRRSSPSPSPTRPPPSCAQRIRAELARRGRGCGSERAASSSPPSAAPGSRRSTASATALLAAHPVAAGIDPGFRVLDAPEAERAAREAFDEALAEFLAGRRPAPARRPSPPSTSKGLRGDRRRRPRRAAQPRRRRAARCPSRRRRPRRGDRCGDRRRPRRVPRGAEARATPNASRSSEALARLDAARPAAEPRRARSAPHRAARRSRSPPYREAIEAAIARTAEAGEGGVAYRHLAELLRALLRRASRPPRSAAPGSTSRTCRSSPPACSSGPRSARPTAAASATCWSTSSRTPTACSCG